jgi:hypothetical protein
MDCSSGDLASKDLIYKILTLETSIVSITFLGSILRMNEKTASRISASISCSLAAPALITAAKTCKQNIYENCGRLALSKSFSADIKKASENYNGSNMLLILVAACLMLVNKT